MGQNIFSSFCQQSEPDTNLSKCIKQGHHFETSAFENIQHGKVIECMFNKLLSNTSCSARLLLALLLLQHFTWCWVIHFPVVNSCCGPTIMTTCWVRFYRLWDREWHFDDGYAGYRAAGCFAFHFACQCSCNDLCLTMAVVTAIVGSRGRHALGSQNCWP